MCPRVDRIPKELDMEDQVDKESKQCVHGDISY